MSDQVEGHDERGAAVPPAAVAGPSAAPRAPRGGKPAGRGGSTGRTRLFLIIILILVIALAAGIYWFSGRNYESTDDAFIDGNVVQLSSKISGTVIGLHIDDNQQVHKGELLIQIDPRDYAVAVASAAASYENAQAQAAVQRANLAWIKATTAAALEQAQSGVSMAKATAAQSQAQIAVAEAEAIRAKADVARYEKLAQMDIASRQRYEQAQAQARTAEAQLLAAREAAHMAEAQVGQAQGKLDEAKAGPTEQVAVAQAQVKVADAQVLAAKAALDQALLNLSYTKIEAPQDGVITKRAVNVGDEIQKDQNLAALVFGMPWVTANFKETQLSYMRPGQSVAIRIDAYPGKRFKGHVDSIQRGTGARFSLLPPENATGNYVKVVQRVPVKIVFDEAPDPKIALGLGMSVVPTVDLASTPRH